MHFAMAFGLCYGPVVFFSPSHRRCELPYAGAVLIMGTIAFPAAFLTTSTSGTILNLAPDRVLRVITAIGLKYPIAIFVWALAMVAGLSGLLASFVDLGTMLTTGGVPRIFGIIRIPFIPAYGLMMLGIVLMHGFCWYLGLQYRARTMRSSIGFIKSITARSRQSVPRLEPPPPRPPSPRPWPPRSHRPAGSSLTIHRATHDHDEPVSPS